MDEYLHLYVFLLVADLLFALQFLFNQQFRKYNGDGDDSTVIFAGYTHGISGSSTSKDLETALQIAYLYYTQPRFDADEYNQGINQIKTLLPNLENQPNWHLQKELAKTIYDSPRSFTLSNEVLEKANLATIEKNYKELFKDAAGLTMVIAGDFDKASVIPMIEKYIGSINKGKKATDWSYRGDGIVDGKKVNDFRTVMQTPMVTVAQIWKVNEKYSVEAEVSMSALEYILVFIALSVAVFAAVHFLKAPSRVAVHTTDVICSERL